MKVLSSYHWNLAQQDISTFGIQIYMEGLGREDEDDRR
jgi:hypothetical protein